MSEVNTVKTFISTLKKTLKNRNDTGKLISSQYASVIDVGQNIAIATDGVGTKILLASEAKKYDGLGHDLVAMNVNDLLCAGATPLCLVDHYSYDHQDTERDITIANSLVEAANIAKISIVGGETAVLPGIVNGFDLSGTAIGLVTHSLEEALPGYVIFGLESSGVHSNGFTWIRKNISKDKFTPDFVRQLLTPTKIYVDEMLEIFDSCVVGSVAHITGGGFRNLSRVCSSRMIIDFTPSSIFKMIKDYSGASYEEMYSIFNMGIGMVFAVPSNYLDFVMALEIKGLVYLGKVENGKGIRVNGIELEDYWV